MLINYVAKLAKKYGVAVAVDSDAYICYGAGECLIAFSQYSGSFLSGRAELFDKIVKIE